MKKNNQDKMVDELVEIRKKLDDMETAFRRIQEKVNQIAHDFTNILTGISGYLDLAIKQAYFGKPVSEILMKAEKTTQMGKELTIHMLKLSKEISRLIPGYDDMSSSVGIPVDKSDFVWVLFMDDEAVIRDVTRMMLEDLGYGCDIASTGEEAVDLYKRAYEGGTPYDIVILDLKVAGGMGGEDALSTLLEINPEIKAIACTGYLNDPTLSNLKQVGFAEILSKPYEIEELEQMLSSLLDV